MEAEWEVRTRLPAPHSSNLLPFLSIHQVVVVTFILMQIRCQDCLSSDCDKLACSYQRWQSMAPLIYHLFGLSYVSQSSQLFLKVGHQSPVNLSTWACMCVCSCPPPQRAPQAYPTAWKLGGHMNCLELHPGGSTGGQRNGSKGLVFLSSGHHVCASLLPHTWQAIV